MSMTEEEEDALWNSWTSRSDAAIILDGRKLNDVFSSIRNQLEFLRRQHQSLIERIEGAHHHHQNQHKVPEKPHDPAQALLQELLPPTSPSQSYANLKGSFASTIVQQAPPPQVLDAEELQIILDRIQSLETDVRKHELFGDRIDKLEAAMNAKFATLHGQMDKLTARVDANSAMAAKYEQKFQEMEEAFAHKLHAMSSAFDDKLGMLQQSTDDAMLKNETAANTLRDLVQVNELRLKKVEKDANKNTETIRELQETIDYFPVKYLDNIRNDIVELYMVKASKDDLSHKFDTAQAHHKADQTEVVRLEQHAIELTRRLDLLQKELHDGFGTVDTKLEKRIDKVAHWCLKHLRRELKERNFDGTDENREGTDIGRVKCLVCDQVVVQQRETEIVHGGPPMKNVIKPHHIQQLPAGHNNNNQAAHSQGQYNQLYARPRSASPPPSRGRGLGTGPTPQAESSSKKLTQPGTLPSVNVGKQQTATTHSKLVKLGAQPIVGGSDPAGTAVPTAPATEGGTQQAGNTTSAAGFSDEVEPAEDFNFRVETDVGTPQQQSQSRRSPVPAEESPIKLAHAAPMHTREHAHTIAVSASQPVLQQHLHEFHVQQDNFRDLEERLTGGRRQSNSGVTKQLNYKYDTRPQTAPMKRGLTGSKLKNNSTRPMPFEDP